MKTLKTKAIRIFTAVLLLVSTMPKTALAVDAPTSVTHDHIHCSDEHIHCNDVLSTELETNTAATPNNATKSLGCLLGLHSTLVRYETIETGGHGYDYCNSYTVYEISYCIECGKSDVISGEKTEIPHNWSVGWCAQTCKECGIVEKLHEDGGCWYCRK